MSDIDVRQLEKFSMRGTQLLSAGRTMELLSQSGNLTIHAKVYAEGGENSLHAHDTEDHAFFVLAGEATFTAADGSTIVLQPYEGMTVPSGVFYTFLSSGEENLVLLRVSARCDDGGNPEVSPSGIRHAIDGGEIRNAGEPVAAAGRQFGL